MAANDGRLRSPSVSRRISIRFLHNEPSESTSTLVLNAGGATNLYTDFRPFLDNPANCDWAFAGQKEYISDGRCAFSHLVDNRVDKGGDAAPDVGLWKVLANGDLLETGEMPNPASGRVEKYQEVWREEDIVPGTNVVALKLMDGDTVRGVCIQVGDWAQEVVRTEYGVCARRSHFAESWRVVASHGPDSGMLMPLTGELIHDTSTYLSRVNNERVNWVVAENYTWNP
ncbi:uncharacterized protein PHACADRAFT_251237 [Phanerochaete carnosa HHB-10118-sp]|uniref:Protein HRI1 n=1 Tax=Phanerochaete carnosa (strain HHB-10118-sp) TaxID=650164 RepID=K5WEQ0_PHACS|nr:uncharacterized protein PHACADRAFT_251237 [Phanerochaete carnosa HHB-10118-sp]EKM57549.1 hypothetical protein PHACADRAFT_251237 [Phanerochaete carnosa HHB-10118-sp]